MVPESVIVFEAWRQNLQYSLSLNSNFAPILTDNFSWLKKSSNAPQRGFTSDREVVPTSRRRIANQKNVDLELMLGRTANFRPVVSRNTTLKNSTSIKSIWQAIRAHYGFQSIGAHFLDLSSITLNVDEHPEDLYKRLMSFIEDTLLVANSNITHHVLLRVRFHVASVVNSCPTSRLYISIIHYESPLTQAKRLA